jgi:hypothetical protein
MSLRAFGKHAQTTLCGEPAKLQEWMNEQNILASHADHQKTKSTLFGFPRPIAGALIGVLILLFILLPLKFLDYNSLLLYMLALDLELLGRMTVLLLGMFGKIDLPEGFWNIVSITISSIPAGIAGWMIGSLKKSTRTAGIVFSLLYLCFILAFGSLLTLLGI